MSGTSLDGLDMAYCVFFLENDAWKFELKQTKTVPYDADWKQILSQARNLPVKELDQLDKLYGAWLGEQVNDFIATHELDVDFVSSHGHTVYHDPGRGETRQIGDGLQLSVALGLPVINDFRSLNVRLGGQGAPLVPIGDLLLFSEYRHCLNLGGIANLSSDDGKDVLAYDICICNTALNYFAGLNGLSYDEGGKLGRSGIQNNNLLDQLNSLEYFSLLPPKSLDSSYFFHPLLPVLENSGLDTNDQLNTYYQHIASQVRRAIDSDEEVLVTGGGAHNSFLIETLQSRGLNVVLPEKEIIDFKEALVFAFMGIRRYRKEVNCLRSVCGGPSDMCLGEMHGF